MLMCSGKNCVEYILHSLYRIARILFLIKHRLRSLDEPLQSNVIFLDRTVGRQIYVVIKNGSFTPLDPRNI